MLATILALIKRQGVTLPQRRVELYELYLKTLLESWRKARNLDHSSIGPDADYLELLEVLQPLALWLRDESPEAGLIHREALMNWLWGWYEREEGLNRRDAKEAARRFLDSVHRYSSLLLEKGRDRFGFLHLTFEEYLAAKALARLPRNEVLTRMTRHLEDSRWHDTFRLTVGALGIVRQDPEQAGTLLEGLIMSDAAADQPVGDHSARVLLAGDALLDIGAVGAGKQAARRVTSALVQIMRQSGVDPKQRRRAGLLLGGLGWEPDDLDAWIEIASGPFPFGEAKELREVSYRYWIAKYPVTNLQYARFVAAGGYSRRELWSDEGWVWREREDASAPRFWNASEMNSKLCPVVGVSWYEAEAYCRWLGKEGLAPTAIDDESASCEVRLPTSLEWERAARGSDGRKYPWGSANRAIDRANFERVADGTTAVSAYPAGLSPAGVEDMAGNVWEWCADRIGTRLTRRLLRGGSWLDAAEACTCAYCYKSYPSKQGHDLGFLCTRAHPWSPALALLPVVEEKERV